MIVASIILALVCLGKPTQLPSTHVINVTSIKPLKRTIEVRVIGTEEHFVEADVLDDKSFNYVIERWSSLKDDLSNRVLKNFVNVNVKGIRTHYVAENRSVVVEFEVVDRIWVSDGKYTADFLWLLEPLGLDFIGSNFKETCDGLYWSGSIEGIETEVKIELPPQPLPYKAWAQPIGHCHGHVWWESASSELV